MPGAISGQSEYRAARATFFSPSLYLTSSSWPSLPVTMVGDIGVGHGAARPAVPVPEPVGHHAATAHSQENVDGERLLAAIRLRHGRHADERAFLDVGERRLDHAPMIRAGVGELHFQFAAVARLDGQHLAVDLFDLAADADGLRLLREEPSMRRKRGPSPVAASARLVTYVHCYLPGFRGPVGSPRWNVEPRGACAPIPRGRFRKCVPTGFQFRARSASTNARSSAVTAGCTPNHNENPRTA